MLQTSVPIVRYGTYRFYRKLLEPPVVRQLLNNELFEDRWSLTKNTVGFRAGHSTETAVLCVLSDILHTVGHGDVAALVFWTYQPLLIRLTMISCCESTYVFLRFLRFFSKSKKNVTFYVFWSGWPRFLEHCRWSLVLSRLEPLDYGNASGTRCRKRRHHHHHWRFSVNVWKPGLSDNVILISLSDLASPLTIYTLTV